VKYQGTNAMVWIGDEPGAFQVSHWRLDIPRLPPAMTVLVTGVEPAPDGEPSMLCLALKDGTMMSVPIYDYDAAGCTCALTPEQVGRLRAQGAMSR